VQGDLEETAVTDTGVWGPDRQLRLLVTDWVSCTRV
jgi:hypothetical protein